MPLFKGGFAFTTVCMFSLYMRISWTGAAACQFTMYMALNNLGHVLGAGFNRLDRWVERGAESGLSFLGGVQVDTPQLYVLGGVFVLLPLLLLPLVDPGDVDRRKQSELVRIAPSSSSPEG